MPIREFYYDPRVGEVGILADMLAAKCQELGILALRILCSPRPLDKMATQVFLTHLQGKVPTLQAIEVEVLETKDMIQVDGVLNETEVQLGDKPTAAVLVLCSFEVISRYFSKNSPVREHLKSGTVLHFYEAAVILPKDVFVLDPKNPAST